MEDLTKQQIVLLTLLVSFVTSIATGIVTVSLMDQAPPAVTQTINRVVERTIERAVQVPNQNQSAATVMTKETVVVSEDDMVVAAVSKNSGSIVRLAVAKTDGTTGSVSALGVMLTKDGLVAVDEGSVFLDVSYVGIFPDGTQYPLRRVYNYDERGIALFQVRLPEGNTTAFAPAPLADANGLQLGQATVFIGGRDSTSVVNGIVSSLKTVTPEAETASTTAPQKPSLVRIVPSITDSEKIGGELVNLSGGLVGFETTVNGTQFVPSNFLSDAIAVYIAAQQETETAPSSPPGP